MFGASPRRRTPHEREPFATQSILSLEIVEMVCMGFTLLRYTRAHLSIRAPRKLISKLWEAQVFLDLLRPANSDIEDAFFLPTAALRASITSTSPPC